MNTDWDYFWANVRVGMPDECWPWVGCTFSRGYGRYRRQMPDGTRISRQANRVAYESTHGPLPAHLFACHTCDNPPCCNPAHLFAGTSADNAIDRDAKGRGGVAQGSKNANSKLTKELVSAIRAEYVPGETRQGDIARRYGVAQSTVSALLRGDTWRHVDGSVTHRVCAYRRCDAVFEPPHLAQIYCCREHNWREFNARNADTELVRFRVVGHGR